jgi:hypothetical protein
VRPQNTLDRVLVGIRSQANYSFLLSGVRGRYRSEIRPAYPIRNITQHTHLLYTSLVRLLLAALRTLALIDHHAYAVQLRTVPTRKVTKVPFSRTRRLLGARILFTLS